MGRKFNGESLPMVIIITALVLAGPGALFISAGHVWNQGQAGAYDSVVEPHVEIEDPDNSGFGRRLWAAVWGDRGIFRARPRVAVYDDIEGYTPSGHRSSYVRKNPQNPVFTAWPTPGSLITSRFGFRPDPFTGKRKSHSGTDIDCELGEPIYAAGEGLVKYAGPRGGYGAYTVEIDHGDGFVARYGHDSAMFVATGDEVTAGQKIGTCGTEGRSTGTHLHISIWKDGELVDPLTVLPR